MPGSNAPLPPATFFILFALAAGAKHGYAIMQDVRKFSDDTFRIGPATLYTTIQRLLDSRWIEEVEGHAEADSRRRYYRLTGPGRSAFQIEVRRIHALAKKAKTLRLLPEDAL